MRPLPNARLIVCRIPAVAGVTSYVFDDVPELRGKKIVAIEVFDDDMIEAVNGVAVITVADLVKATLTLKEESKDRQEQWPLFALVTSFNAGIWKEVNSFVPNYQKCTVNFNVAPAMQTAFMVPFMVYYIEPDEAMQ